VQFLFYIGFCLALYVSLKQVYGRYQLPRIASALDRRGWRIEPRAEREKDPLLLLRTGYAAAPRRILGYMIDLFLFLIVGAIGFFAIYNLLNVDDFIGTLVWLAAMTAYAWLYSTLLLISRLQATLGMLAAGVFRTNLRGERLTFARASALFGFRILSYIFYGIGFFVQPFTAKRQTFHDLMAKSVVLRGRMPLKPSMNPRAEADAADPNGAQRERLDQSVSPVASEPWTPVGSDAAAAG
jgi:uncharacterized RDD family membrane protein YckC